MNLESVKDYWERYPLLSHEIGSVDPIRHWELLDAVKLNDIETFSENFWRFDQARGKRVLDIGCGPGWLTVKYAERGADVYAIDLTHSAVEITNSVIMSKSLNAKVLIGNAESLSFEDNSFDVVVSSGVLHHIPNTDLGFSEAFRVTRPGGTGLITLYRRGLLHTRMLFPVVRILMKLTRTRHPGADLAVSAISVDDFIRQYDGEHNPIGRAQTRRQWQRDLEAVGWHVMSWESHYFPLRMSARLRWLPRWIHKFLDRKFGTMIYFEVKRPAL